VLLAVETLLILLPAIVMSRATPESSPTPLFQAAAVILVGGGLYRLDTALIAFLPGEEFRYFPTVAEMTVTLGFTALAVIAYIVIVKRFPILPARHIRAHA
jgi:Ni/Fe-hydrogenase subunit HybB-like protein